MTKEEFYKQVNKGRYPKYVLSQIKEGKPKKDCSTIVCTASDKILLAKYENCKWHQACFTSGSYDTLQHIYYVDINEDVIRSVVASLNAKIMTQYIEKSALLAEIERLVNNYDKALDYEAALEDVRNFLDTLEVKEIQEFPVSYKQSPVVLYGLTGSVGNTKEEPQVKESAEIERDKETCKENGDSLTQEPVSDDLNEAAIEYFKEALSTGNDSKLDAFRAGANWQKQKDNQNESDMAVIAHLDGVEKGKKIMREQMMRGALEGKMVVGDESQLVIPSLPIITRTLDDGDKVKVIIIKED